MNKNHRTFLSAIVFISVFFLSAIFYFPILPIFPTAPDYNAATEAVDETRDTSSENNSELQSFSYTQNLTLVTEDQQERQTEASLIQKQEDNLMTEASDLSAFGTTSDPSNVITEEKDNSDKSTKVETDEASLTVQSKAVEASANVEVAAEAPGLYADLGISIADSYVYVRKEPSTDSEALGKLYKDSAATILQTEGEWYLVESGSITGYIKSEYLKTGISDDELIEKYGQAKVIVDVDGLNVRKQPGTEADRVDVIYKNEIYPVLEADDTWVKIDIEDDKIKGYVMREYVRFIVEFKEAVSKEEEEELLRLAAEEKAKKETQVKQQEAVSYSKEDLKLLACLVHAEAGSQSYEGKLAVANVVLNRVKSSKYPDTIKEVIYQPGQFSVAASGSLQKQLDNYKNYSSNSQLLSIKAAKEALNGSNNIGSRLYFHSYRTAVNKGYDDKKTAVKIGGQLFW